MNDQEKETYTDFANVEVQNYFLTAEEFPEGPYGSPIKADKIVKNKETPWKEGQQYYSNFTYENRTLHEGLPRQMRGSHPTHDEENEDTDPYFDQTKTSHEK
jgi:hypothetical protein